MRSIRNTLMLTLVAGALAIVGANAGGETLRALLPIDFCIVRIMQKCLADSTRLFTKIVCHQCMSGVLRLSSFQRNNERTPWGDGSPPPPFFFC